MTHIKLYFCYFKKYYQYLRFIIANLIVFNCV
jgi:hypothetical protein